MITFMITRAGASLRTLTQTCRDRAACRLWASRIVTLPIKGAFPTRLCDPGTPPSWAKCSGGLVGHAARRFWALLLLGHSCSAHPCSAHPCSAHPCSASGWPVFEPCLFRVPLARRWGCGDGPSPSSSPLLLGRGEVSGAVFDRRCSGFGALGSVAASECGGRSGARRGRRGGFAEGRRRFATAERPLTRPGPATCFSRAAPAPGTGVPGEVPSCWGLLPC
ncbi:hypothetical protein JOD67_003862 [Tenggerimyces flavus]|nr:hypothetical protein [Tenggerimyces flavus]